MLKLAIFCTLVVGSIADARHNHNAGKPYAHKLGAPGMNGKGADFCPRGNGCGWCTIGNKEKWVDVSGPFVQSCAECRIEPDCMMVCQCKVSLACRLPTDPFSQIAHRSILTLAVC